MDAEGILGWLDGLDPYREDVELAANPDGSDLWQVASRVASTMPRSQLERAAAIWLVREARDLRRGRTQQVERAAARAPRRKRTPEEIAEREEEKEASWHEFSNQVAKIMNEYAAMKHTEWTQELLDARFALPDGSTVTWGDASVDDHKVRVEMFQGQAEAAIENGARHQQAINVLTESGTPCLREYIENREE